MGIFYKRPLCLFCFCFIGAALISGLVDIWIKVVLFALFVGATILLLILSRRIKKRKYGLIEAALCVTFAAASVMSSIIAIDVPLLRAKSFEGESAPISFVVCEKEYSSKYSTKYQGILLATDKGEPRAKAYLTLDHEADFGAGDHLLLVGDVCVTEPTVAISLPSEVNLEITSTLDKDLIVVKEYSGFSLYVTSAKIREYIRDAFFDILDARSAALSLGILTSNTSMLSGEVTRDFRRAGVSHLLAVSGLHLSVIIGVCEFILMKLRLSKILRSVILSIVSLVIIVASGFSLSACRSVLMLLVTYLCYMLAREPDTLTSLSLAGTLILFFSPISVGSLSFWMSFLATLGIVLYSEVSSKIHKPKYEPKRAITKILYTVLRKTVGALMLTFSANVFLCIVFFVFFGEFSVISPISNLTVTPLGEVYLVLSILTLLLGKIPFVGTLLCKLTSLVASLMTSLAASLSSLDFSVVSLRYAFAGVIIITATLALLVLFIVKLKDKRILFSVPATAIVAFCICLAVYNGINSQVKLAHVSEAGKEAVIVADGRHISIADVSDGSYSSFFLSYEWAKENAYAEVDSVILTHYHANHIRTLDKFFRSVMVRNLYLPTPETGDELLICRDIIDIARDCGVSVEMIDDGMLNVGDKYAIYLLGGTKTANSSKKIITLVASTKEGLLCYTDASWYLSENADALSILIKQSDALILGAHSRSDAEYLVPQDFDGKLITPDSGRSTIEFSFGK